MALVGLPPYDLLDELAKALREKGLDIDEVFQRAVSCSNEFLCPVVVKIKKMLAQFAHLAQAPAVAEAT